MVSNWCLQFFLFSVVPVLAKVAVVNAVVAAAEAAEVDCCWALRRGAPEQEALRTDPDVAAAAAADPELARTVVAAVEVALHCTLAAAAAAAEGVAVAAAVAGTWAAAGAAAGRVAVEAH